MLPAKRELTIARLHELEPETGNFIWRRKDRWNGRKAGTINKRDGYRRICVDGEIMLAHRLVWFYVHGAWPDDIYDLDHKNQNRLDNRLSNLRLGTRPQNQFNVGPRKTNKSGFKGVSRRANGKWWAKIGANGKVYSLGIHDDPAVAHQAYVAAAKRLHGEFAKT
jgi:HNH endonuclease/AP2 domain